MRLRDIAVYLGISPDSVPDINVKNLHYDSRTVQPEDVFIALVGVEVGLFLRNEDAFQCGKFAHFLSAEVCGFVEHETVAVAEDVG